MPIENVWLYVLASTLLLAAHVVRTARWALLFSPYEISRRFDLLLGLALGYAINTIFPWRLGELFRIWFVASKTSLRITHVASTVVAERFADLIAVSIIALYILVSADSAGWPFLMISLISVLLIVLLCILVRKSKRCRRILWDITSVFNEKIRNSCIDLVWSVSEMVLGGALLKPRFLVTTVAMWALYICSYAAFAEASGQRLPEIIFTMLGTPLRPSVDPVLAGAHNTVVTLLLFTGVPVLGVLMYGAMKQLPAILYLLNARTRYGWYGNQVKLRRTRHRFKGEAEYRYFLASLFSGGNQVAISFGLDAIDDGKVHKLFPGGSDAITAMVEVNERLLIRKFAVGAAGVKLKLQRDWLENHGFNGLPLVKIVGDCQKIQSYHYDMPLVVASSDFYDFIHTNPIEESKRVLSEVIEQITEFHDFHSGAPADEALIKKYLAEKAAGNATLILDFAHKFFDASYSINGSEFTLDQWDFLLDPEWLFSQISSRSTSVVHGDLTVENIIIAPQKTPNWYIIDPNPDNIFNTRLIDLAKLMQSVHLGYEGLNRNFSCLVENNSIQLLFTKSQAYTELHHQLEATIRAQHGEDGLREIYFHELINYLRLIPYKIRQDPNKGLCFFGCASLLLKRYLERAI